MDMEPVLAEELLSSDLQPEFDALMAAQPDASMDTPSLLEIHTQHKLTL